MEPDSDMCTPPVREARYALHLKTEVASTEKCLHWFNMIPAPFDSAFRKNYGNLDKLLKVEVIPMAVITLAQFFEPEWKCFVLPSFLLGPTVEEFDSIFAFPTLGKAPYLFSGQLPDDRVLAKISGLQEEGGQRILMRNCGTLGVSEKYLGKRLVALAEQGNWLSFSSVLALAIFGLILFPEKEGWISHRALDVFIGFELRKENPAPAILSNIYGSMFRVHTRKKRILKLQCCLHALYVWMVYRFFPKPTIYGSILDTFFAIHERGLKQMSWKDLLRGSSHPHIRWGFRNPMFEHFIYRCGEFPNVPLIGTLGCYAYNPILCQRQLGFDLVGRPDTRWFRPFELHFDRDHDSRELVRIQQAWREPGIVKAKMVYLDPKMDEEYSLWIEEQVFRISLPFAGPNEWVVFTRPKLGRPVEDDPSMEKSAKEADERLDEYLGFKAPRK